MDQRDERTMERKKQWRIKVTKEQWDERNNGSKGTKEAMEDQSNERSNGSR